MTVVTHRDSKSRRVVVTGPEQLQLESVQLPALPAQSHVRVRVRAVGICGSDLHVLGGHHPFVTYPVFPGHEILGTVEEVSSPELQPLLDQRVVLEPSLVCGHCPACRRGDYNICESLRVMGFQAPGGMADLFDAPADRLHLVPQELSDDAAVLVEPTAVAMHAVKLATSGARTLTGAKVAVFGAGTIGLLVSYAAADSGAEVSIIDPDSERLEIASQLGFEVADSLEPRSFDVAFECAGSAQALRTGISSVRKGGVIMLVGVHGGDTSVQSPLIQDNELSIIGTLMYTSEDYEAAFSLLAKEVVNVDRIISARIGLSQAEQGYSLARKGGDVLKVVLVPD